MVDADRTRRFIRLSQRVDEAHAEAVDAPVARALALRAQRQSLTIGAQCDVRCVMPISERVLRLVAARPNEAWRQFFARARSEDLDTVFDANFMQLVVGRPQVDLLWHES